MAAISFDPRHHLQVGKPNHGVIVEEVEGLIKVYRDGRIERPPSVPQVPCTMGSEDRLSIRDIVIDKFSNLWARVFAPSYSPGRLPLVVYFHGGGFCVGSAAWACYHEFLSNLATKANCVILSINYRLAPENRLPAAYDDGIKVINWIKQLAVLGAAEHKWWLGRCDLSSFFLSGDSAGANIAYNVVTTLDHNIKPLNLKGIILIQPFFGGETRTSSEKYLIQPANSALTLSSADTYWRLSLPVGSNRDHPYSNPLVNGVHKFRVQSVMVCISEMDIMKDRNTEFCAALASCGTRVEKVTYKGVGHAFQILHNSPFSQIRIQEMMSHLRAFINQ